MRYPQPQGVKGSLKWIQVLVNRHSSIINNQLAAREIEWLSPLENDDFSEYRDYAFLEALDLNRYQPHLKNFWPARGPQWDALGKADDKIFLVEAKANIPEIGSSCGAKSPISIAMIEKAIKEAQIAFNVEEGRNWLNGYYQYANRLAHLYFLRNICRLETELVFVYFCNDPTHIPTSISEWKDALAKQKKIMGIKTLDNVSELFIDCKEIKGK